ncbi:SDR family NAD(P)-dependent oxidoreductase [Streptomyces coeruleorubidus]|uniref:SDR family NAD(P)-dependent oxidoreductase n=1 Tax=Streptomyces coeruleorubidus TaxID=116188 RepID=A0ABZ0KLI8_STRC4|nr:MULTISPECIES: SDR family NAD(P)-dependent oxidoreductase [Streptomyces]MDK1346934.1 SDR family NAD(P)-dependent oxidoreductase [Streptomyces sp. 378]WOT38889.1 SDR family NAD(P)-dependent oxidoreductase [Streptomyces coeruleorubidus]
MSNQQDSRENTMVATGSLDGRVAVITGSTRSIGRAIAEAFLADGATVVVSGRSEVKGKQALEEMDAGDRAVFHPCDANSQEDIEGLADFAAERFGRLDIWVNNVGGSSGFAPIHQLSDEAWHNALNLNVNGYFYGTRRALPKMLEGGWGRIINISSVEGKQANKPAISHYITNKHAIHGLTKATAFEYGTQGITCNAICPGAVDTDLMRAAGPAAAEAEGISYEDWLGRFAEHAATKKITTVEQIAAVASLLASEAGAGITGTLISVDGGTAQW